MRATVGNPVPTLDRVSTVLNAITLWGVVLTVMTMALSASWQVIVR